jgi:hypothetical protein
MSSVCFPPEPPDRESAAAILGELFAGWSADEVREAREALIDDAVIGADCGFEGWDDEEYPR